jgi:hypothetical protein
MDNTSDYAKFHLLFLGYSFKSKKTGRIFTKGELWDKCKDKAVKFTSVDQFDKDFEIVNSPGWDNGNLIK